MESRILLDPEKVVNLNEVVASVGNRAGVIWALKASGDLNANLVRFEVGQGVGTHVNDEMDVLVVGVAGSGFVEMDDEEHTLGPGILVFVPRGTRRSTRSATSDFAYLTIHRRRGPFRIGVKGWSV